MDIKQWIDAHQDLFTETSDKIWAFAETRFEEYQSAELLIQVLKDNGFTVEEGVADMKTAFVGTFGSGKPVIGYLGEYDALSGLSQVAASSEQTPIEAGEPGHGCGHNLLGVGALAAAMALKEYMIENNLSGTVKYFGTPGEEGGSGKAYMARAGVFDGLDAALTWHPSGVNVVRTSSSLANYQVYYKFHGRASHAAGAPHLGRSALDAVELMSVGVNYLREHVLPEARMHYAVLNSGGTAPNVVQAEAEVLYLMRAPQAAYVKELYERINNIARGAALMTGTTLDIVFDKGCSNIIPNPVLEDLLQEKFLEVGPAEYTEEERKFAKEMQDTCPPNSVASTFKRYSGPNSKAAVRQLEGKAMCETVIPYDRIPGAASAGSSDVGDVSWVVPTAQISAACYCMGTPGHSWQQVSQCVTSLGHKGMLLTGKVLALAGVELLHKPELLVQAKESWLETLDGQTYECPIPEGVMPAIRR